MDALPPTEAPTPLADLLRSGRRIDFPAGADDAARTIPAAAIAELIDPHDRSMPLPLHITGARITGDLVLEFVTFPHQLIFQRCEFDGQVNCASATFRKSVHFENCRIAGSLNLMRAEVAGTVDVSWSRIEHDLIAHDANVARNLAGVGLSVRELDCRRVRIDKACIFRSGQRGDEVVVTSVNGEARFNDAAIGLIVDMSGAEFHDRALFSRMRVGGRVFFRRPEGVAAHRRPTIFRGNAEFRGASFGGSDFEASQFLAGADFGQCDFGRMAYFSSAVVGDELLRTTFAGVAIFSHATTTGVLAFAAATFGALADFTNVRAAAAVFTALHVGNHIAHVVFAADVLFNAASFERIAHFMGAEFRGRAEFRAIEVGGDIRFDAAATGALSLPVRFSRAAIFISARISANALFTDAEFLDGAWFSHMAIGGALLFSGGPEHVAVFRDDAVFYGVSVAADAVFAGCSFVGEFRFCRCRAADLRLAGVSAEHVVLDWTSAGGVDIGNAEIGRLQTWALHVDGDLQLRGATLQYGFIGVRLDVGGRLILMETQNFGFTQLVDASVDTLILADETGAASAALVGSIDVRRLRVSAFSGDMGSFVAASEPFHRDSYLRTEKLYRAAGDDEAAGRAYHDMRVRARKLTWQQAFGKNAMPGVRRRGAEFMRWLFDWLQAAVFRYGIRPYRLLVVAIVTIAIGAVLFARPGAVAARDPRISVPPAIIRNGIGWRQSIGMSLRLFIPVVELPAALLWIPAPATVRVPITPSRELPVYVEFYAIIHRILGVIVVPLGITVMSGLLVRRDR